MKKSVKPFQAVIFDLDGTLLDTLQDLAWAMNQVLQSLGFREHPVAAYKQFVGEGVERLVQRALPPESLNDRLLIDSVAQMRSIYQNNWHNLTQPYPGIEQMLQVLQENNIPLAVLSNKPHEFTSLCVKRFFPGIDFAKVQGALPKLKKPDPDFIKLIIQDWGIAARQVVFVGDTNIDMKTARVGGFFALGVAWGFRSIEELWQAGAQKIIKTPQEILQLFQIQL
jgi:phosphoglycolate phosphatase